jgi:hypothetical protein
VPADALGAVARHEADEQGAHHRDQHRQRAEVVAGRRDQLRAPALEVEEVGGEADQPQQDQGHAGAQRADAYGQGAQRQYVESGGEVPQGMTSQVDLLALGAVEVGAGSQLYLNTI